MSKKIFAGVGIAAALGVAMIPVAGSFAAIQTTTVIKATVEQFVGCSNAADYSGTASATVNVGTVPAGSQASSTFIIGGTTNNPTGFKVTGTPSALVQDEGDDSIAYSATALSAGVEGWFLTASDGNAAGATIGNTIELNSSTITNEEKAHLWTLGVTVGASGSTSYGAYTGSIEWVCTVNQ